LILFIYGKKQLVQQQAFFSFFGLPVSTFDFLSYFSCWSLPISCSAMAWNSYSTPLPSFALVYFSIAPN